MFSTKLPDHPNEGTRSRRRPYVVSLDMSEAQTVDPVDVYRLMVRMRLAEEELVAAWTEGLVPGEYHSGIGEEGINAGVLIHLGDADAVALDHRGTGPLIARGSDPLGLMLEVMGSEEGMNSGHAGHMHLMDPKRHVAADGIVGSSGPLAVGHAIALQRLRPGRVAVAFHGEAAMNQGMLMEAYNMAVAWSLPVLFVCKDNQWSITTFSAKVTGGDLIDRAQSFGLAVDKARGERVDEVHEAAGRLIARARKGEGPGFLYVTCHRPSGHFEGDPLVRIRDRPINEVTRLGKGILSGLGVGSGGTKRDKTRGLGELAVRAGRAARAWMAGSRKDPLRRARKTIPEATAHEIERFETENMSQAMTQARERLGTRPVFGREGTRR